MGIPSENAGGLLKAAKLADYEDMPFMLFSLRETLGQEAEGRLKTLAECLESGDHEAAGRMAHSLAGGAAYLGMELVREKALEMENCLRRGDAVGARKAHRGFPDLFRRSMEALDRYIARMKKNA